MKFRVERLNNGREDVLTSAPNLSCDPIRILNTFDVAHNEHLWVEENRYLRYFWTETSVFRISPSSCSIGNGHHNHGFLLWYSHIFFLSAALLWVLFHWRIFWVKCLSFTSYLDIMKRLFSSQNILKVFGSHMILYVSFSLLHLQFAFHLVIFLLHVCVHMNLYRATASLSKIRGLLRYM